MIACILEAFWFSVNSLFSPDYVWHSWICCTRSCELWPHWLHNWHVECWRHLLHAVSLFIKSIHHNSYESLAIQDMIPCLPPPGGYVFTFVFLNPAVSKATVKRGLVDMQGSTALEIHVYSIDTRSGVFAMIHESFSLMWAPVLQFLVISTFCPVSLWINSCMLPSREGNWWLPASYMHTHKWVNIMIKFILSEVLYLLACVCVSSKAQVSVWQSTVYIGCTRPQKPQLGWVLLKRVHGDVIS